MTDNQRSFHSDGALIDEGTMTTTDELERQAFEAWFKRDFHPDKTGPYVKDQLYFAWVARAKQESNIPCEDLISTPDHILEEKFKSHFFGEKS